MTTCPPAVQPVATLARKSTRNAWGWIITASWLILVAIWISFKTCGLGNLSPNELGDFFAGVFSPIAFLWLVLGYMQQGEELRATTRALLMQEQELANQVRETKALVEQTAIQAKASADLANHTLQRHQEDLQMDYRATIPMFACTRNAALEGNTMTFEVMNIGANVHNLTIRCDSAKEAYIRSGHMLRKNESCQLTFHSAPKQGFIFRLYYYDSKNRFRRTTYMVIDSYRIELHEDESLRHLLDDADE